jgi:putative lipoic acid-binding regulatory protein
MSTHNGADHDEHGQPTSIDDAAETVMEFPLDFPIKVIGRDTPTFHIAVFEILDRHFADVDRDRVDTRPSRAGKYLAITTTVRAESRAQLDAVYQALTAHDEVLWAL